MADFGFRKKNVFSYLMLAEELCVLLTTSTQGFPLQEQRQWEWRQE
jgi:hypothetical protein